MAYGLKYQSDFYNFFQKLVSVKIYKQDYASTVTQVRTTEVSIECNYQDEDTPIVGTGAKVVIIATTDELLTYDDLLTSREKEFLCTIEYNNVLVFQGFSICDLNERQFLPFAKITLQFTDYLRRLEGKYLDCLKNISTNSRIFDVLTEAIQTIGLDYPLLVNSTVLEQNMDSDSSSTFIEQTYVENAVFFTDAVNYDDAYVAINKILLPFGAHLYSWKGNWVVERQEDILKTGQWVNFLNIFDSDATRFATTNFKEEYNKQLDDFKYTDSRQTIEYASGLYKLILNLRDKQLDTSVFNDYDPATIHTTGELWPSPGTLELRTWHHYTNLTAFTKKYNYRGMATSMGYMWDGTGDQEHHENAGIYYSFEIQFDVSDDNPTMLEVSYKMSSDDPYVSSLLPFTPETVSLRFSLRVDDSPGAGVGGYYLLFGELPDGTIYPYLDNSQRYFEQISNIQSSSTAKPKVWDTSVSIDMTSKFWRNNVIVPSIWEQLGKPAKQKFIIMFWPPKFTFNGMDGYAIATTSYLGDVDIKASQRDIPNKITYYVKKDFVNTKEIDLDLYDLNNVNFCNGLRVGTDGIDKTALWTSRNSTTTEPLVDIFAKSRFRNYYRTMHRLKGVILYDGYIKPLAVITDDNLQNDSSANLTFIMQNYTWDLDKGTYDIVAQEYTDDDIVLEREITESWETPEPVITLDAPSNIVVTQPDNTKMVVSWNPVQGATRYRLKRSPYYFETYSQWIEDYIQVYLGSDTTFEDLIPSSGPTYNDMDIYYIVCAENDNISSPYSDPDHEIWIQ
jgi:hypothetical protein